ncbi:hypothetical protein E8E13_000076 [Curvularia kusanoi]|uniref:Uncharacterized protein n=1 Tax=Curvularia kusanoi TaxID=90978 RepID=A0A9P4W356_CURKU|nr:hypothetical protein E8E13_000076 [Curvularia kusanoi]
MHWRPSAETCLANDSEFSCTLPDHFEGDGDIAGPGVFWAFVVAAFLPIIPAGLGMVWEGLEYRRQLNRQYFPSLRNYFDAFLISVGDTQIVTSLALLITADFFMGCNISAYHYNLACKLVLISSASHIASIAFVHRYFKRSLILGAIRCSLILGTHAIGWDLIARRAMSPIFPNAGPSNSLLNNTGQNGTSLVLPAACFFNHPGVSAVKSYDNFTASPHWILNVTATPATNSSIGSNGTATLNFENFSNNDDLSNDDLGAYVAIAIAIFLTLLASCILNVYERSDKPQRRHWTACCFRCSSFIIVYVVMFYEFTKFRALQGWMIESGLFGEDDGETTFGSFGQVMPVILLALPLLAGCEEIFAESKTSKASTDDEKF